MTDSMVLALGTIAGTVVFFVVLFMVCRAVMLWYWKVDEQIALLKEIRDSLRAPATPSQARPQNVTRRAGLTEYEAAAEAEVARLTRAGG